MGAASLLRDFLAVMDLGPDAKEIAKRENLSGQIVATALQAGLPEHYQDQADSYAAHLRLSLAHVSSSDLEQLIENDVLVCLDPRLDGTRQLFKPAVFAMFYRQPDRTVLSLTDTRDLSFVQASTRDIGEAVQALINRNPAFQEGGNVLSLCRLDTAPALAGGRPVYAWHDQSTEGKTLSSHQFLRNPPIRGLC